MPRDAWTFIVVRGADGRPRQFECAGWTVRAGSVLAAGLLAALVAMAVALGVRERHRALAAELRHENEVLSRELVRLRDEAGTLARTLEDLSERDARYRLAAGLPEIPRDVRRAGIGGPGTPMPGEGPLAESNPPLADEVFAVSYDLRALVRRAHLLSASLDEAADTLRARRELLEATPSILPVAGLLTSSFSRARRHPILHKALPHEGVDVAAAEGTPILAAARGRVAFAGWKTGYGRMVELDHGFGFRTRYAHASKTLVRRGDTVERGEAIALVGRTGLATGPNLHYEVIVGGRPVNPMSYVIAGALPD